MINENEIARELNDALAKDLPGAKLAHKPFAANGGKTEPDPTLSVQIDQLITGLEGRIRVLKALRETL